MAFQVHDIMIILIENASFYSKHWKFLKKYINAFLIVSSS